MGLQKYSVVRRASRFSVVVRNTKGEYLAHLTNSGRLLDLIFPSNTCLCVAKKSAKTKLRLVGVPVSERWAVLIDPLEQTRCFVNAVNAGAIQWLDGWHITGTEVNCGESRIDYKIDRYRDNATGFIETKSAAMLLSGNVGSFPDCPTVRGRKHVKTMLRLAGKNRSIILFLVQHPDAESFSPSVQGDEQFVSDLADAIRGGVEVRAIKMSLSLNGDVVLINPDLKCIIPEFIGTAR